MVDIGVVAVIVFVLVLLNGLFVAAEFAIIATPRSAAIAAARKGGRALRRVRDTVSDPRLQDRYIATAQVGITLASLGLGMYGEHSLAEWLAPRLHALDRFALLGAHAVASILAIATLTYLHIVIGEMIPKALALQYALPTARAVSAPMLWAKRLMFPLVVALNATGNGILRLAGVRREFGANQYHTPEELRLVVEESRKGGLMRREEAKLVKEALEFAELTAGDAMVPRVTIIGIPIDARPERVAEIVREHPHTRYPVYRGDLDHILGAVHVRDLVHVYLERRPLATGDLRSVPFIPATTTLDDVLETLRRKRAHMAVVMDEHGGTAGMLTAEDLLEELAGEIQEDGPPTPEGTLKGLLVPGTSRLDELGERLGRPLEHEEVDTVSGLVLALLERPALTGDTVTYEGLRFEVVSVAGRGVRSCLVTREE